jgi:hypothetical protein
MPQILLTYDLDKRHTEVKTAMIAKGYSKFWMNGQTRYNLPNTTLYKSAAEMTPSVATNDLQEVVAALNRGARPVNVIHIERMVAVEFTNWSGIPGLPN